MEFTWLPLYWRNKYNHEAENIKATGLVKLLEVAVEAKSEMQIISAYYIHDTIDWDLVDHHHHVSIDHLLAKGNEILKSKYPV